MLLTQRAWFNLRASLIGKQCTEEPRSFYQLLPSQCSQRLAVNAMRLQQGKDCKFVSVSVILQLDGSIAEYTIENSVIELTYMLTYESATELLYMNLEEEEELRILQ